MRHKPALVIRNQTVCFPDAEACRFLSNDPAADDGIAIIKFGLLKKLLVITTLSTLFAVSFFYGLALFYCFLF